MAGRKTLTVRLSQPAHQMAYEEARQEGVSVSQLVREALLLRILLGRGRRNQPLLDPEDRRTVLRLLQQLQD